MKNFKQYALEYSLLFSVVLLTITGFWKIYFGMDAQPTAYQNFHVITNFTWIFLLIYQLSLIGKNQYAMHRKVGLSILVMGPLLTATTTLLSVYSAYKGMVSGKGDFMIVQNVMGTLELAFLILLAFIVKEKRKLHGASMLSTVILFMGIALFFTLISFVPPFIIKGPETFYRFRTAMTTICVVCLVVGFLFFISDRRNNWPMLLAGLFPILNNAINVLLLKYNLIKPLTEFVGSFSQALTFLLAFLALLGLLISTGIVKRKRVVS